MQFWGDLDCTNQKAATSICNCSMKIPSPGKVGIVRGDQAKARSYDINLPRERLNMVQERQVDHVR